MFVGVLRLGLSIVAARSLKDRRRVVRSFKERMQAKYRVSVAEVGDLDHPKRAWLGVAVVSNEAAHCHAVLEEVASAASCLSDAILTERATEVIPLGLGGAGVQGGIEAFGERLLGEESDDEP